MAKSQVLTGARAKIMINGNVVGLFTNCSWSIRQGKEPLFIVGRHGPAEITPTSQEAVTLDLSGYRIVDAGPYKVANATMLKNLLNEEDFSVAILDRQTGKFIFQAVGCRTTGFSSGVSAKGISDLRISVVGLKADDETTLAAGGDAEDPSAANIDDGI